jgi:hypothetical protein
VTSVLFIASLGCLLAAAVALGHFLPAQNIAFIILFLGAVEAALEFWLHMRNFEDGAMFWPGAIILLRMAGQRLLRPWRQARNYGLFLIGLTSVAAAVLQMCFGSTETAAGRMCLTAICLVLLTPWFLQKHITVSEESRK